MTNVTVREVTRVYGETAPGGDYTREEKVYEVGADIEGVFVPFTTFTEGHVQNARARADAEQQNAPQQDDKGTTTNAPAKPAK